MNTDSTTHRLRSSSSLLGDQDPPRPNHQRSTSSPSSSFSFLFQRLAVDSRSADNKAQSQRKVSPTRRRLVKRYSGNVPFKMDQADGPVDQDKAKEAARRMMVQNDHPHLPKRPLPPSRPASYSKRHASFDSPREIPLPSPSSPLSQYFPLPKTSSHDHKTSSSSQGQSTDSATTSRNEDYPVFDTGRKSGWESGGDSLPNAPPSPKPSSPSLRHPQPNGTTPSVRIAGSDHTESHTEPPQGQDTPLPWDQPHAQPSDSSKPRPRPMSPGSSQGPAGLVFPFSRPYSLPQGHSNSYGAGEAIQSPKPIKAVLPNRSSSASLPLPMQTPYYTLPQVPTSATLDEDPELQGASAGEAELSRPSPPPSQSQLNGLTGGESDIGSSPLPPTDTTPSSPAAPPARTPPAPHRLDPLRSTAPYSEPPIHPMTRTLSAASSVSAFPAPEAPVILTPPPPPTGSARTAQAPYEPFLCHNAMAEDRHSIAVETSTSEYRLIIRLPGFSRDAITLATRRRRILHVVADSWAPGGGHFERRVSFGYDADLSQVRAEFDGETLRVTIPRRISPVAWSSGS